MKKILEQLILLADQLDTLGHYNTAKAIDNLLIKTTARMNPKERFWAKVDKTPTCWIWLGARTGSGYGIVTIGAKNYSAHKLAWEWENGRQVPKGQVLLHACDNRTCVRPSHLTPGTQISNVDDRVQKDRSAKGPQNGRARLKEKDIKKIKMLRNKGWTETAIAKLLNVSRSTVSHILHGRTWGWITASRNIKFTPAFRSTTGEIIISPGRHNIRHLPELKELSDKEYSDYLAAPDDRALFNRWEDGFVDKDNNFYSRAKASEIATSIIGEHVDGESFSLREKGLLE